MLPAGFVEQAYSDVGVRHHNSLYAPMVVLWLLVRQRLEGGAPLEAAVLGLGELPSEFWPHPCKRVCDWRDHGKAPSSHTGAYNQARQALPLEVVQKCCDRIFQELMVQLHPASSDLTRRAFLLDGTSIRTAHSPELCALYPAGSNQHGEGHWPVLRMVVAHDLLTGLAMRPEWGPFYGPEAVSEQRLLELAIDRLPAGSVVVGDSNFGVFSVGWAAAQRQHPVVLRLTAARAKSLAGGTLHDGIDREVVWKPSAYERKQHPEISPGAQIRGHLIVRQVQPDNGGEPFLLALFTTLAVPQEEILALYGQRWNIETDLRTLKSTLNLDQLTCTSADMVAKEIEMGMAAYNLVRAVTCRASEQSGVPPRGYSFTKVQRIVRTFTARMAAANDERESKRIFDQMMHYVQQAKLSRRRKRGSYPRAVWQRGAHFPSRKNIQ